MSKPTPAEQKTIKALREMHAGSRQAKMLFAALAAQKTDAFATTIDEIKAMAGNCVHDDALTFLKSFGDLGLGTFLIGRSGHPTRIEWEVSQGSVGRVASGEDSKLLVTNAIRPESPASQRRGNSLVHGTEVLDIPTAKLLLAKSLGVHASKIRIIVED